MDAQRPSVTPTIIASYSSAQSLDCTAYGRGDIDFDGDNDLADFVAFRTFYNEANGGGALEALTAVPEPSTAVLVLLVAGGWFGCHRRLRKRARRDNPKPNVVPTNSADVNFSRLYLFALSAFLSLTAGHRVLAQEALFDFGNGDFSVNNATPDGLANFVISDGTPLGTLTNTQNGVEMTLTGITTDAPGTYDSNSQGFGIVSAGDAGGGAAQRRLDTTNDGETVQFSFDTTVNLVSLRVGSLSSDDEGFVVSFISGDDPFGGGNFTYTTSDGGATEGPDYDIPLGNIAATAGTVFEFSTINEGGGGILWNGLNTFVGTPPSRSRCWWTPAPAD